MDVGRIITDSGLDEQMEEVTESSPLHIPADGNALRESFGDRRIPDISRKITACVACRKHKIKCNLRDGPPPCSRCKKRGLSCTVNRSLQMLMEEDANWKNSITRKVQRLEAALTELRGEQTRAPASSAGYQGPSDLVLAQDTRVSPLYGPSPQEDAHRPWEVVMDPESGPATVPAACVGQVEEISQYVRPPGLTRVGPDLIDQGIINYRDAQKLLSLYSNRLDHFLYNILDESRDLDAIRTSSSLLLAAICTVGALHSLELAHMYEQCYKEFLARCAAQTFLKENKLDDIKGLCIGAFWLSEISWNLVGTAVRLATQLQLHRSINAALRGDIRGYHETRLYYLVFVCDRHFSIAYGRPPMSKDCDSIKAASDFLTTKHVSEDDRRLVSQVNIWCISGSVFEAFGIDVDRAVPPILLPKIHRFMISLDTWRADWSESFGHHAHVGDYPRKGIGLHFHFAKLHLCSFAYRGITHTSYKLPPEIEEIANAGVASAKAILRTIIHDAELQSCLNGLPLYFDTMIAFAVVFLLKVGTKFSGLERAGETDVMILVKDMALVLRQTVSKMHRQHLLRYIAEGIDKILQRYEGGMASNSGGDVTSLSEPQLQPQYLDSMGDTFPWIEDFDLLSSHGDFLSAESSWQFPLGIDASSCI